MNALASLGIALRALNANKLRAILALLGITIGVAVVITMVAIGTGAQQSIEQHVKAAGANLITVTAGNYSAGDQDPSSGDVSETQNLAGGSSVSSAPVAHKAAKPVEGWAGMSTSPRLPGRGAAVTLSLADREALAHDVAGVSSTAPGVTETAVLAAQASRLYARLQGTDVQLATMRGFLVRSGRFFSAREVSDRLPVFVLSESAATKLFGSNQAAIGKVVQTRRKDFKVIGVVAKPGAFGMAPTAAALDEVFAPYTAIQDLLGITHLHSVSVSVAQAGESTRAARDAAILLRQRHALGSDVPDDFVVRTQARDAISGKGVNPLLARAVAGSVVNLDDVTMAQIASSLERSSRTMTALLASVASVSLLVGGIGIMNIMLVSVTERTREIGLRMAVGARGRDVLIQFLAEAITLSVIGGLIGSVVGIAASGGVGRLLRWSTVVSPGSVALSVCVAAAVGVFFGFYPARQAARLDPIDALRFE
jgi:ABC-type antimicrobial peptide transport system permease subunit